MSDGTGRSGSTGWNNSFRGRMYQERVIIKVDGAPVEPDSDLRVLRNNKLNYGKAGTEIRIRYDDKAHVFVNVQGEEISPAQAAVIAEQAFMDCLVLIESQGREVNTLKNGSPKVFAALPEAKGQTKHQMAMAMERLLKDRRIRIVHGGSGPRRREYLTAKPEPAPQPAAEPAATVEPVSVKSRALDVAIEFLRERLAAGRVESGSLFTYAKEALISRSTLQRAAAALGVKSSTDGVWTMLSLP
jgi:hypothetical protein